MSTIQARPEGMHGSAQGVVRESTGLRPRWIAFIGYGWFVVAWIALAPSLLPFMLTAALLNGVITLGLSLAVASARLGLGINSPPAREGVFEEALRTAGSLWWFGGTAFFVLDVIVRL